MGETAYARLFPISLKLISPVVGGPNPVLRRFADIEGNHQRKALHSTASSPLAGARMPETEDAQELSLEVLKKIRQLQISLFHRGGPTVSFGGGMTLSNAV